MLRYINVNQHPLALEYGGRQDEANFFQIPLDKHRQVWYNKFIKRGELNKRRKVVCAMENIKMTKVKALEYVLENCVELPSEVVDKLTAMKEQCEKRASAPRKESAKTKENANLRERIIEFIADAESPVTCTDIGKAFAEVDEEGNAVPMASQRVSSLLSPMVKQGRVVKTYNKKIAYFSIEE